MSSPKLRSFSPVTKLKKGSPYLDTKVHYSTFTSSPRSVKSATPFVQDTLSRITSPFRKTHVDYSPNLSPEKLAFPVTTPKKVRPTTTGKFEEFVYLPWYPTEDNGGFPQQSIVHSDLSDSLRTLKTVVREYEDKVKEKKVLQKVVDQLKSQVAGMQAKKVSFSKNYEKLHKDAMTMNQSALSKENQRVLIGKNIIQVKDAVLQFDKDIQESIVANVEVAQKIKEEQNRIMQIKAHIAEMKRELPAVSREKDKVRNELQVSSKLLKNVEEKFTVLTREKVSYVEHIDDSKIIRK